VSPLAGFLLWVTLSGVPPRAPRVETFVLEEPAAGGRMPVAVVTLRSLEREAGPLLELDATFREGGVTVLLDEHREADGWHQVRRELRGPLTQGRTSLVEPAPGAGLCILGGGRRVSCPGSPDGRAPRLTLELLEALRRDPPRPGTLPMLDLESEAVVRVDLRWLQGDARSPGVPEGAARTAELRRDDGSLIGRYVFVQQRLVAFQWQEGARWARAAEPAEVDRLRGEWRTEHDPLAEVWAAVRAGELRR